MWLTCDQTVLLCQLSRSPRKKKRPIAGYQRDYNLGNIIFFLLFSTLRVFYLTQLYTALFFPLDKYAPFPAVFSPK